MVGIGLSLLAGGRGRPAYSAMYGIMTGSISVPTLAWAKAAWLGKVIPCWANWLCTFELAKL